jgi:hypothetical protein
MVYYGDLIQLLESYLANRNQRVVINVPLSNRSRVEAGVPQGSILLLYINDTCHGILSLLLFADDTAIIVALIYFTLSVNRPLQLFMPPIIKCRGHYVMAYAFVSVNIPSIIGQTPGSIDPIFLWLIGGDYRERFLSMISSAAHPRWALRSPSWILFPSIRGSDSWLCQNQKHKKVL